jgi:4-amino-4-deoxy-L-arabinose transferase-like glycosyltransferase
MARRKSRPAKSQHSETERALSSGQPLPLSFQASFNSYSFFFVLAAGILLRVVVFVHMGYLNNDNHLEVIEYVAHQWTPPHAGQFNQAFHPPLYYFLAASLLRWGNVQAVHGLSLILSIGALLLIAHLLRQLPWINEKIQPWCLALAAFQPQFVMFSLFISNDALAIFLAVLIFYQCRRVQVMNSFFNYLLLGIWLGLGLLTKAVFLVFLLPVALLVWMTARQQPSTNHQPSLRLAWVVLITMALGCYKYVENFVLFGNPTISNLDLWLWARNQQPTWIGPQSLFDLNLLKLVSNPVISPATVHSYSLMIYGSFWYALIPESTFRSNLIPPFHRLGSMIYLVALCPTLLMLVGAARIGVAAIRFGFWSLPESDQEERNRLVYEGSLILTLLLNFFLIFAVGWRYDVWSVFQGRLLFPSYFPLLLAFSAGMEWAEASRLLTLTIRCLMIALMALFLAYLMVDVWLSILYPVDPLRTNHMPYVIDMNTR